MARRRAKSGSKPDDPLLLLEPPAVQPRGPKEYALPCALFIFILFGGSMLGWFCSQQQQAIEELTEALTTMQTRITKLQQQLGSGSAQLASVGGFEERLLGLEEAYAKAQRQAEVALAASEQIKSKDLQNKVWALQTEMNAKLAELQQNSISIASLNAVIKNKSEEFEAVKQSVSSILSVDTELAVSVSGLTSTLSLTESRLGEHVSVIDGLKSQLKDQKREITEMKESFTSNQEALVTNVQELMELRQQMEVQQVKRAQAFKEQLKSLHKKLEDHQTSTKNLHSQLADQLKAVQTQFLPGAQTEEVQDEVEEQADKADDAEQASKGEPEPTEEKEVTVQAEARAEDKVTEERVPEEKGVPEEQGAEKEDDVSGEQGKEGKKKVTKEQEPEVKVEENVTKEPKEEEEVNEKQGVTAGEEEHSAIIPQEFEKKEEHRKEHDAEKIQTSSLEVSGEDTDLTQTEKDEQTDETVADETDVDTISEEALSLSEEPNVDTNEIEERLAEEQVEENAVAESLSVSNDVQTAKTETEDVDGAEEQDSESAAEESPAASDETDSSTNETEKEEGDSAQTEAEAEHEPVDELPEDSAKVK